VIKSEVPYGSITLDYPITMDLNAVVVVVVVVVVGMQVQIGEAGRRGGGGG